MSEGTSQVPDHDYIMSGKISVIMGVYNAEQMLPLALDSIIKQSYDNWELIVCDDGSADNSYIVAQEYAERLPDKIHLLHNDTNLGLNATLNRCLAAADGEFIARQDADDISHPDRFAHQISYLVEHPEYSIVSTAMTLFDEQGEWGTIRRPLHPTMDDLMKGTPFAHAPSMVRADAFAAVGGYSVSDRLLRVEDYHLWYKMYLRGIRGSNLPEALYLCQDDRSAQGRRKLRYRLNEAYVKWLIWRNLPVRRRTLPLIVKPILTGLMPAFLYSKLHRGRHSHPEAS